MNIQLTDEQVFAIYKGEEWWNRSGEQVLEISGPAGSGKTFLVRYLIERFGLDLDEVLFVAYMGKAAMIMARNGLPAQTIHSAIYNYEKILDKVEGKIQMLPNGRPKMKHVFVKKERLHPKIKLIVLDEGSMVNEIIAKDLLSFNIPVIVLGDLNQLPPVFGNSFFLNNPDIILTKIMRQAEQSPIIYLSQQVLNGNKLTNGVYGNCAVINKSDVTDYLFNEADIVLTGTNRLRYEINNLFRTHIKKGIKEQYPNVGEKIICRQNNINKHINDNIYLTNGMVGYVDYVDIESFNGKQLKIDFRPDFLNKSFKNLIIDYNFMYSPPSSDKTIKQYDFTKNKFEFAYAITTHMSQGSQYQKVLFLPERMGMSNEDYKKFLYTGITRAQEKIIIAI